MNRFTMPLLLLACCVRLAAAQSPVNPPASPAASFYGGGVSLLTQSSPKPTGWLALAVLANQKNAIYSFSELDFTAVGQHPIMIQTSALTGIATPLRTLGPVTLYALGAGGAATTGSNSGGAITGGAFLYVPLGKSMSALIIGYSVLRTTAGGTEQVVKFGLGQAK